MAAMALQNGELARLSAGIIKSGSKSFAAASRLFDPQTRVSAHLLYAWCRHCDDVIDGQELGSPARTSAPHDPHAELAKLRALTTDALAGKAMAEPVFQAFQAVMAQHQIPARLAFEHLDGFAMDVDGRSYASIDDTLSYCYHVAGVVGVMMAHIMGVRDDPTLDRACDLGLAFQLTNIARDIVDDAKAGRCYLPAAWLSDAGLTGQNFADAANRVALFGVAKRMIELAETYYDSAAIGMAALPLRSAWAIGTARAVYHEIGREIVRRGPAAWDRRVSTSKGQKIGGALDGGIAALRACFGPRHATPPSRKALWQRPSQ